jgi:hypothetical protein
MNLQTAKQQLLRNVCWSTLFGFLATFAAAFVARFWAPAWLLLPYGIDDPFAPLLAVIWNSLWILATLVVSSLFRKEDASTCALPIFELNLQVFGGEVVFVFLVAAWHNLKWRGEQSVAVPLILTAVGQLFAYLVRIGIKHKNSPARTIDPKCGGE